MQSILRRVVAGPRQPHAEANLDLCYVTDFIIATSGPSSTYPQKAYRNPTSALVTFLDSKHASNWAIWEFRAEGTGYPDSEVHNRIWHFPWPDHHPPPFHLVPPMMASMRNWLHPGGSGKRDPKRVVVVHCKAGKGRSGTAACSYLMTEEGWTKEDVLRRFTEKRMRPGFGAGVSIPSQLRYLDYVERWIKGGKVYVEQQVEVMEIHVWGLRDGVKIAIEGYIEDGRKIKTFHVFHKKERHVLRSADHVRKLASQVTGGGPRSRSASPPPPPPATASTEFTTNVIYRASRPVQLPTNDINLAVEKRANGGYGLTMVTAVAHVWFNTFFESSGPENHILAHQAQESNPNHNEGEDNLAGAPWASSSGIFSIDWDAMDGIKGSTRKGVQAFDKIAVVWRIPTPISTENIDKEPCPPSSASASSAQLRETGQQLNTSILITEPSPNEPVESGKSADWEGEQGDVDETEAQLVGMSKNLGLRERSPVGSPEVSRTNSLESDKVAVEAGDEIENDSDEEGVKGIRRGLVEVGPPGKEEIVRIGREGVCSSVNESSMK